MCAETWDSVGGERDGQLAEIEKEKTKERRGSSERSHRPVLYWLVGVVIVWRDSMQNAMQCKQMKEKHSRPTRIETLLILRLPRMIIIIATLLIAIGACLSLFLLYGVLEMKPNF